MVIVWGAGPTHPPVGRCQSWDWSSGYAPVDLPPTAAPGGTFRRRGDLSRVFRPHGEPARVFRRRGDPSRVFRANAPR